MPTKVEIRYTPKTNRVKVLIKQHLQLKEKELQAEGGKLNKPALYEHMGVTDERFKKIADGKEVTLSEAVLYADFMRLPVTALFKVAAKRK